MHTCVVGVAEYDTLTALAAWHCADQPPPALQPAIGIVNSTKTTRFEQSSSAANLERVRSKATGMPVAIEHRSPADRALEVTESKPGSTDRLG